MAYYHVQRLCHSLGEGDQLKQSLLQDVELMKLLKPKEIDQIFRGERNKKHVKMIMKRVL